VRIRHLAALSTVALLAAFAPHTRTAPNSWALIIGISDYINFGDEIGGDLPGARFDALGFRDVLVARYGFPNENIRLLLDHDATRDRITTELGQWLPSVVKPGDLVVVFYAGHGSQAWDTNGDEEDGLDETICPADVIKGNADKDIPDDEFNTLLNAIPTDNVAVVLDNCHAGTGTRAVTPFARPRSLARDATIDLAKPANATEGQVNATAARAETLNSKILEIAAAQAGEVAVDAEWPGEDGAPSRFGGAFTTSLLRNLWQAPAGTSYKDIFERTAEDMKRERFAQQPSISRAETQPAFTPFGAAKSAGTAGEAFVPVLSVNNNTVELGGGAAAGLTVGSTYTAGSAILRITGVDAVKATAQVVRGSVKPGARAKLEAFAQPTAELRVSVADIAATNRPALSQALGAVAGVKLVENRTDFAHLLVRPRQSGYVVLGMDGAVRHTIEETGSAAATNIADLVAREAAAHQLAVLENPAHPFTFDFGFTGERAEFKLGDAIEFRARSSRAGYLTIVDLGTDGTVTVIYPNEAERNNRVTAGQEVTLPTARMREAGYEFSALEPAGRGIVRAFLTEQPLKLSFSSGTASQAAEVARALRAAAGVRAAGGPLPVGNWATASVVYSISK